MLDQERQRLEDILRGTRTGTWEWNVQTGELIINERWAEIIGYSLAELAPISIETWFGMAHPDDLVVMRARLEQHFRGELGYYDADLRLRHKDGHWVWVQDRGQVSTWTEDGKPRLMRGTHQDINERKLAEDKIKLAASVFSHAREGIVITTADGTIIDVNDAFTHITGYRRDEVLGRNPRLLQSGRQSESFYRDLWRSLVDGGYWSGELCNRRKNGELYSEILTISAVCDDHGRVLHYVGLFSDITLLKQHQQQLEHLAYYDALTMLPNRVLLADRLQQAIRQAKRHHQQVAVVYLDLDGFKAINDCHGHQVGDQLLIVLAARMRQVLRQGDTLARLGGDEFVAVLVDLPDRLAIESLLVRLLAAVDAPVRIADVEHRVTVSLGVTFYPQLDDVDADQLLRQADQAMYQAKLSGRNSYHCFDAERDRHARGRHESLRHIRHALARDEFTLYYQPKVNLRTGTVIGAEALIRWQHPEHGLLSPVVFLPVIEDHPLEVELGEWVIDTALSQIEAWREQGLDLPVSVNVGARQLQQIDFVDRLQAVLSAHPGVAPSRLSLEVLETSAFEDLSHASRVITDCCGFGVETALDDFGTGYASLTYLKRLPVATLKIDQSFVRDMLDNPEDLSIVESILGLSTAFGLQVIAEGVESPEQGELLLQLGCELAQGHGIARPMPGRTIPDWVATWRPDPCWVDCLPLPRAYLPLIHAFIEHRAWSLAFIRRLETRPSISLPPDTQPCRLGEWLRTAEGYPAHHPFQDMAALHRRLHEIGQSLLELQTHHQTVAMRARLSEFHDLEATLSAQFQRLLRRRLPIDHGLTPRQ